jgi:hypothetical protein
MASRHDTGLQTFEPDPPGCDALVVMLWGEADNAGAATAIEVFKAAVPRAGFVTFDARFEDGDDALSRLDRALSAAAHERGILPLQIILIGLGRGVELALQAALFGDRPLGGVIALDTPLDLAPGAAPRWPIHLRMVQRASSEDVGGRRYQTVVDDLHTRCLDVRSLYLPGSGAAPYSVLLRGAQVFLVELVAYASSAAERRRPA